MRLLWLTDSDDAILNANGGDLNLFRVNVEKRTDGYYLTDYWYSDARYIESLTILDDTKVNGWGMERAAVPEFDSIPEPATATLSLLALAGLAARRRRR